MCARKVGTAISSASANGLMMWLGAWLCGRLARLEMLVARLRRPVWLLLRLLGRLVDLESSWALKNGLVTVLGPSSISGTWPMVTTSAECQVWTTEVVAGGVILASSIEGDMVPDSARTDRNERKSSRTVSPSQDTPLS